MREGMLGRVDDAPVSVVIPTFNRARYLPDAIRCVLGQTHRDLELIVVDDGSTDDTREVMESFGDARLQYVRIDHSRSPARARNVGIARAGGQFLAFLDSDDVWLPEKLERQLRALRASPGHRWSYTTFDHIDEQGEWMAPLRGGVAPACSGWILERMVTQEAIVMVQSVLAEAGLVREVGGFDETPHLREDLDLCFRLAARSEASGLDGNLLRVRHHPTRTTFALPEVRDWRVRALRKLADSSTDQRLRGLCRRECGRELAELAGAYEGSGRRGAALATLVRAARYDVRAPGLWGTLGKTLVRPFLTPGMTEAIKRARDRRRAASRSG